VPNWVQDVLTGAIIVGAVAIDRLRHRATAD
jgi:ribose/xylose/arabinose/galactoside ABC-type transport system permease subunit